MKTKPHCRNSDRHNNNDRASHNSHANSKTKPKRLHLQSSLTLVTVELEHAAALKSVKPASVILSRSVCVRARASHQFKPQEEHHSPNTHTVTSCMCVCVCVCVCPQSSREVPPNTHGNQLARPVTSTHAPCTSHRHMHTHAQTIPSPTEHAHAHQCRY